MSSKLDRIIQMDALIRSGAHPTVATFRTRFEVSERTVHHDLEFLRERLNAPLTFTRQRGGYAYTDPTWTLPALMATEGELLAFFLSVELSRHYLGTAFEAPLRKTIDWLARTLPEQVSIDLGELMQHYTFSPGATARVPPALLADLGRAIAERWRMQMTYFTKSRGETMQRVIEPYHIHQVRGDWQVIAFDHYREQIRNFAVDSIQGWTVLTDERFIRDPNFASTDYLAQGFQAEHGDTLIEVVIWFDAYQARYIRGRMWHPTQQIAEHDDGSLTLRFQTGAVAEVTRWVLGFGSHARVEAPAHLREAVRDELRGALKSYDM
jgi:predicted DNA-binding transcriptional regulator YafY